MSFYGEMKHHESKDSAQTRNSPFAASMTPAMSKKVLYAGHTPLEQLHLGATFRTKSGVPLHANVPPQPKPQTSSAAIPPAGETLASSSATHGDALYYSAATLSNAYSASEPAQESVPAWANSSFSPVTHAAYAPSAEPESNSLHTMVIGSIVMASVALGLGGSLWINSAEITPHDRLPPISQSLKNPNVSETPPKLQQEESGLFRRGLAALGFIPDDKASVVRDARMPGGRIQENPQAYSQRTDQAPDQARQDLRMTQEPALQPESSSRDIAKLEPRPSAIPDAKLGSQPDSEIPPPSMPTDKAITAGGKSKEKEASRDALVRESEYNFKPQDKNQARTEKPVPNKKKGKSQNDNRLAAKSKKSSSALAKDEHGDEIGRLKTQAFSETTNDRISGKKPKPKQPLSDYEFLPQSNSSKKSSTTRVAKTAGVREALARCQLQPNFFRREHCKWQLCDGQWGKNGCPSFESKSALY